MKYVIVDEENKTPDGRRPIVGHFDTVAEACAWMHLHHDQDKVYRGGFGLEGRITCAHG